jgi:hypothetical protein
VWDRDPTASIRETAVWDRDFKAWDRDFAAYFLLPGTQKADCLA